MLKPEVSGQLSDQWPFGKVKTIYLWEVFKKIDLKLQKKNKIKKIHYTIILPEDKIYYTKLHKKHC